MSKRNGTMPDYVSCPFCQETDFDLIGLKHHFQAGHCDVWNEIPPPPSLRPHGLPEGARVIATCDLSTTAQETRAHPFFVEDGEPTKGPLPSADLLTPPDCDCTGKTGCVGQQEGRTCLLSCLGLNR
jgi:hypothetical protein